MTVRTLVSPTLLAFVLVFSHAGVPAAQTVRATGAAASASESATGAGALSLSAAVAAADAASSASASSAEDPAAQRRPPSRPAQPVYGSREPAARLSAFFHVGSLALSASHTFKAIFDDKDSGVIYGGGAELTLRSGIFVRGDVSRFTKDGQRVFISNGQVFPLGQELKVTMTPIEVTGGYRFFTNAPRPPRGGFRVYPYAGGGVGVLRYREESSTDTADEGTNDSFTSYHILGGVDIPFMRHVSAGAEYQHRWVPNAIGDAGVSAIYKEDDLGGDTFRALIRFTF